MDERSGEPPTRRLVLLAAVGLGQCRRHGARLLNPVL